MVTIARDWLTTLWAASFKGVPLKVERDAEAAGRRIRIHEFPMRDDLISKTSESFAASSMSWPMWHRTARMLTPRR